jgi:preprotein translocase subunit SecE
MNNKENSVTNQSDTIKWVAIIAMICVGMFGFYYFSQTSLLLRVLALLTIVGVAVYIAIGTEKGNTALNFSREAHIEVRKVVWPTKQETIQITGIVMLMVVVIALMIWGIDSILFWIVKSLTA